VKIRFVALSKSFLFTSSVLSKPFFNSLILFLFISKPTVKYFLPNSIASGRPT
jgi:hypothetical protein